MNWNLINNVATPVRCGDSETKQYVDAFSFFFNDSATTEIYSLSLHDALPICSGTVNSFTVGSTIGLPNGSVATAAIANGTLGGSGLAEHTAGLQVRPGAV